MKIKISSEISGSLVVGVFKNKLDFKIKNIDNEAVNSFVKLNKFEAEKGQIRNVFTKERNVYLVGLGEEDKYDLDGFCSTLANVCKGLRSRGEKTFTIHLDSFKGSFLEKDLLEKIGTSVSMGLYQFNNYKTKDRDKIKAIDEIVILGDSKLESSLEYGVVVGNAVNKTRDLINTPGNIATPAFIADYCEKLSKENNLKFTVFDHKKIAELGMECFTAVGKGSVNREKLVILEYNGGSGKPVAIVGKGVTFDSGGLNIKPYPHMNTMKSDKSGAMSAIHVIEAAARLKLNVNLIAAIALAENMPDANSYRPDDILKSYNGVTVEIANTDAEGRLVLADTLAYVAEKEPCAIVDMATLTGASKVVLGSVGTCFVCNDEGLNSKLKKASEKSLEKVWDLPLWDEYSERLKGDVADLKHITDDREAGTIIGGAFLQNFVNDIPWAHLDIGSTAFTSKENGILVKGATGVTVRLLIEMVRDWN